MKITLEIGIDCEVSGIQRKIFIEYESDKFTEYLSGTDVRDLDIRKTMKYEGQLRKKAVFQRNRFKCRNQISE